MRTNQDGQVMKNRGVLVMKSLVVLATRNQDSQSKTDQGVPETNPQTISRLRDRLRDVLEGPEMKDPIVLAISRDVLVTINRYAQVAHHLMIVLRLRDARVMNLRPGNAPKVLRDTPEQPLL